MRYAEYYASNQEEITVRDLISIYIKINVIMLISIATSADKPHGDKLETSMIRKSIN